MDALHVRPKGELQGWSESNEPKKERQYLTFCPFFARPMTIRQDSRIGRTHVRPKGELHGWSESKDERKGTPMNPPFGSVRSLGKIRSQLNSLRFTPLRQKIAFHGFSLHSLTGFRGGLKKGYLVQLIVNTFNHRANRWINDWHQRLP